MIDADKHKAPQGFDPVGLKTMLACVLWGLAVVGAPLAYLRRYRGHRADSLFTKAAALCVLPVVWAAGGGGDKGLFWIAWLVFLCLMLAARSAVGRAAKAGLEIGTRFMGLPIGMKTLPKEPDLYYVAGEPVVLLFLAALCEFAHQPGLSLVLVGGAVALPVEFLQVWRRDTTLETDYHDARVEQKAFASRVHRDGGL